MVFGSSFSILLCNGFWIRSRIREPIQRAWFLLSRGGFLVQTISGLKTLGQSILHQAARSLLLQLSQERISAKNRLVVMDVWFVWNGRPRMRYSSGSNLWMSERETDETFLSDSPNTSSSSTSRRLSLAGWCGMSVGARRGRP